MINFRQCRRVLSAGVAGLAVAALLVGVSAGPAVAAAAPSPWLQTGYNAAGSNANLAEKSISAANVAKLKLVHTYRGDPDYNGCGGGATATAFSESRTYTVIDDVVTAYASYSGKVIWKTKNPAATSFQSLDSTIAVAHGQVVISGNECGSNDPEGFVQAFDSETGKPTWNHLYGDGISAVEVSNGLVVAHVRAGIESTPSTTVYQISDGSTVWTATNYCDTHPGVVDALVFVDYCQGGKTALHALSLRSGATVWTRPGRVDVFSGDSDAAGAKHLFVENANGFVLDLDPSTGVRQHTLPHAGGPVYAVDDQRAYAPCSGEAYPVCAYDLATGKEVWSQGVGEPSAIEANGLLYFTGGEVLDASTGTPVTNLSGGSPRLIGSGYLGLVDAAGDLKVYGV